MKIFISHTAADKPVIEPIALRLRDIFGQDNVFYDAWSIRPGDGIIQKMNEGLSAPDFVFFFVSKKSLASKMTEIEWQNALYSSTKGRVKIVPVRVDGSEMPPILRQNLWIDMHAQGIEAAIQQIVNVVQGQSSFTPQHLGFSNLTFSVSPNGEEGYILTVKASHLMEPNPSFLVCLDNKEDEVACSIYKNQPTRSGFNPAVASTIDGQRVNGFFVSPLGGAITPKHPLKIEIKKKGGAPIVFHGILHHASDEDWLPVPQSSVTR